MATWDDLKAYVRVSYRVSEENGDLIRLVFGLSGGRSQSVLIARTASDDGPIFATIASPFAPLSEVNLHNASKLAGRMIVGGIATYGDVLMLRHAVPLEHLNIAEFEVPLHMLVNSADELERALLGSDDY